MWKLGCGIFLVLGSLAMNAMAKSVEEDADGVFDVMAMYTACQRFSGASDEEAKESGRIFMKRIVKGFLEKRAEMVPALTKLLPESNLRYEKQILFLRNLSWSNRKEICFGMEDVFRKMPE